MSSPSVTWRRIGVSAVAAATVAAGMPLLLSSAANAVPPTRIAITQDNGRTTAAAGTCTAISVTPTDPFGGRPEPATLTVTIAESPESGDHDVDFCLIDDGTPFRTPPQYRNEPALATTPPATPTRSGVDQRYNPGPSITTTPNESAPAAGNAAASPNNPDRPNDVEPADEPQGDPNNNNNPNGRDIASFSFTGEPVRFGVVGLLPGAAATLDAFFDPNGNLSRDNDGDGNTTDADDDQIVAPQRRLTFTAGGVPGSVAVNDAARRLELTPEESHAAKSSSTGDAIHTFFLQAYNAVGDVLGGVTQGRVISTSGPNAGRTSSAVECGPTENEGGVATCLFRAANAGVDTVTGFVNQSSSAPTFGLEAGEPRDTATATTTPPASTNTAEARNIVLTPADATIAAGQSRDFTAAVTNASGAPVNGVSVRFDENGPGTFQNPTSSTAATSTVVMSTTGAGRAIVRFLTSITDRGSNTITATIATTVTQCGQQASGTTPSGNCADSSPVTITAAASPTPSASASASPRPSVSASASTSPRPSTSASPGASCSTPASVTLGRDTIIATGAAPVTVRGTPNRVVDLFAYSRPSTTYRLVRTGDVGSDGAASYSVTPPTNTRLYAQERGCAESPSVVLNVRTQISMNVVRNGVRNYTFSGSAIPARPNGLIVSLYRVESNGRQILTAQTRANANVGQPGYDPSRRAGSYTIRRQFTGSGRFGFVVRTGQDLQNAPGSSNVRSLLVF